MDSTGRRALVGLAAAGLAIVLSGCATPPAGVSSPSGATASPALPSAVASADCAAVLLLRDAYDAAAKAAAAVAAGQKTGVSDLSAQARAKAKAVFDSLPAKVAGQPVPGLRQAVVTGALAVDQFAFPLTDWDQQPSDPAWVAPAFASVQQVVGTVEAIATAGADGQPAACPQIAPLAVPLPTLALRSAGPTPTEGPVPPGTALDQKAAALKALKLRAAAVITFDAGGRVQWRSSGLMLGGFVLDNGTQSTVSVPSGLTPLRWDGSTWRLLPCGEQDTASASGLCGADSNTQPVTPGRHSGFADTATMFFWPGTVAVGPGTYALVLPVCRGVQDWPDKDPAEAAVAIVTLAVNP